MPVPVPEFLRNLRTVSKAAVWSRMASCKNFWNLLHPILLTQRLSFGYNWIFGLFWSDNLHIKFHYSTTIWTSTPAMKPWAEISPTPWQDSAFVTTVRSALSNWISNARNSKFPAFVCPAKQYKMPRQEESPCGHDCQKFLVQIVECLLYAPQYLLRCKLY